MSDLSGMYRTECASCKALRARVAELEETVRFNKDQRRMHFYSAIAMEAERDAWKAVAKKRHAILLDLEWKIDADDGDESYCPYCMSMDDEVHVAGCKMAEAIAESSRAANERGE